MKIRLTATLLGTITAYVLVALTVAFLLGAFTDPTQATPAPTTPTSSLDACVAGIRADPYADTDTTPGCIGLTDDEMIRAEAIALGTEATP